MQTNPERGTFQQTGKGLEEESKMSASRFQFPIVYPEGGTQSRNTFTNTFNQSSLLHDQYLNFTELCFITTVNPSGHAGDAMIR